MKLDTHDTIVAIATARGRAVRGAVRLSGPEAVRIVEELTKTTIELSQPQRLAGVRLWIALGGAERPVAADLFVWPTERSYTHQPSVEVHTIGSPPVLDAIVRACLAAGARLAEPGEFTLRAFLAGRLDLTQAEAVLSVIDAQGEEHLETALEQLAGGLSTPLHRLRFDLLDLLADLEAGLDFVDEEDVRFVEPEELSRRLHESSTLVEATRQQMITRDTADRLPRVALVGRPNIGKSRLFNALVERYGADDERPQALVADEAGVTRDSLVATLHHDGHRWQLIDTAGDDEQTAVDAIDAAARERLVTVRRDADLLVLCHPATLPIPPTEPPAGLIGVVTMADRLDGAVSSDWIATSALTGEGLAAFVERLIESLGETESANPTAERCQAGLAEAAESLGRAAASAANGEGDELVSFELRQALDGLGRVVGEVVTDELLGEIFGKFCIGK